MQYGVDPSGTESKTGAERIRSGTDFHGSTAQGISDAADGGICLQG